MENDTIKNIIFLYSCGYSLKQISEKTKICLGTIYYNLKKNDVDLGSRGPKSVFNKEEVINLYESGLSTNKISKIMGISSGRAHKILLKTNTKIRNKSESLRNKKINHMFFSVYNISSCYWAGFIAADGNLSSKGFSLAINLAHKDISHLLKISNLLNYKEILKYRTNGKYDINCLRFSSKELYMDLFNNFNIIPKKSLILCPPKHLQGDLVSHFIRGYFDGDGHIGKNLNHKVISFLGTKKFLQWIKKQLQKNIVGIGNPTIRLDKKNGKVFILEFGGAKQCPKIVEWLYKDYTLETILDRKYEIAKKYL